MRFETLHDWNLPPTDAVALQRRLADQIDARRPLTSCRLVAGADVSYGRFSNRFFAGVVVLQLPDLRPVERRGVVAEVSFPYVPGLLSFREAPVLLRAFAALQNFPDVIVLDGHGRAHPRRMGIASHIGLWLNRPCVGCAKTLLVGKHRELGPGAGAKAALVDRDEVVGCAVRTKQRVRPVYISVGHNIDLPSAVKVVLDTCRGYRLPEPTRLAHHFVNALRRGEAPLDEEGKI